MSTAAASVSKGGLYPSSSVAQTHAESQQNL